VLFRSVPKQTVINSKGTTLINETEYIIDPDQIDLKSIKLTAADTKPIVLIYHTHTCESYTSSQKYKYIPTDNDRTSDTSYNVVRVGEELANILKKQYKIDVIHDKTIHDGDSYNRAYTKSLKTVQGYLSKYPSISLIIDLHRDAADIGGKN
jgi:stage II sporulation protein P